MASDLPDAGVASPGPSPAGYDRMPPYNLEAEESILGSMLLSKDAIADVSEIVGPGDFYRGAHRTIFEVARDLDDAGEPVDHVTLAEALVQRGQLADVGGAIAIAEIAEKVPTPANAAYYARIVADHAARRRLIDVGTRIVKLGFDLELGVDEAVDGAEAAVFDVAHGRRRGGDFTSMKDLLSQTFEVLEKLSLSNNTITGLETGFVDFDDLTAGLQPGNLIVIAARPAMGKSTLVTNMITHVTAQLRQPAVLFSLEMSDREIVQRMLSAVGRIPSERLRNGRLRDSDWQDVAKAMGQLAEAPLFIDDTPGISLMEIRSKARRLKQAYGLSLVVVDYLQLMMSHRTVDSRVQEVAEFSRGLKILAKELDCPVVALSQLSRKPEERHDKRPLLADLRESGCLTRGTRLFRADTGAPVTFAELLDSEATDVPVWSIDARGRVVAGRLRRAFPSGRKEVFRVRLRSGREVEASANHPFQTLDGWRPLEKLDVGSRVAVPRRLPPPAAPITMDADELVLLAHLIGEGTILPRQPIHYTSADEANLQAVEKAAWNRFGITAVRRPDGRSTKTTQLYLRSPQPTGAGRRNPVASWLSELGLWGARSYDKQIPAVVFALDDDQLARFLHHLWGTDGCLHVRQEGSGPAVSLYYATASPRLARDVQLLLLRFGINSRIRSVPAPTRPGYQVWIYASGDQRTFLDRIGVSGRRGKLVATALERLEGIVGNPNVDVLPVDVWAHVRRARAQAGISDATDDRFWDEIIEITSMGVQEVFDATVADHHAFVAEGVFLHNSIEQDADLVCFIYREDAYRTDETEHTGEAELIVAKHRNGPTKTIRLAFIGKHARFANIARGVGGAPPPPAPPAAPSGGGSSGGGRSLRPVPPQIPPPSPI